MKYIIKGINDEEDTCQCCGKKGLKRVVWLVAVSEQGEGEPMHYGTTCAAKKVYGKSAGKAQDENKIAAALVEEVKAACHTLLDSFVRFGNNCVPVDLIPLAQVDLMAALAERNKRHPILDVMNGKITVKQGAKFL